LIEKLTENIIEWIDQKRSSRKWYINNTHSREERSFNTGYVQALKEVKKEILRIRKKEVEKIK